MKAIIARTTTHNVTVNKTSGGLLQPTTPVTIKNQIEEIRSIEDISDVSEVDVSEGSTLVYNSVNDKYEIRKLRSSEITGTFNLDGGTF